MKKKSVLLLIPFAAMALTGCGSDPKPQCDSAVVTLDQNSISIAVGETKNLSATISVEI